MLMMRLRCEGAGGLADEEDRTLSWESGSALFASLAFESLFVFTRKIALTSFVGPCFGSTSANSFLHPNAGCPITSRVVTSVIPLSLRDLPILTSFDLAVPSHQPLAYLQAAAASNSIIAARRTQRAAYHVITIGMEKHHNTISEGGHDPATCSSPRPIRATVIHKGSTRTRMNQTRLSVELSFSLFCQNEMREFAAPFDLLKQISHLS